jgi:hypothetical protein
MSEFPDDLRDDKPVNQPPPKHDWGFDVYLCRTNDDERKYINTVAVMREHLMNALARRETVLTFELPVMAWMAFCDEIEDRRPRNYSALLKDDHLRQLHGAIDRLHEEINFVIAYGPGGSVAARMDPERAPSRRDLASPELRRILRDKGPQ